MNINQFFAEGDQEWMQNVGSASLRIFNINDFLSSPC
jgi:hypothetical protein